MLVQSLSQLKLYFVWFHLNSSYKSKVMWISLWFRLALCWQNLELLQDHAEEVEDAVLCKLFPGTLSTTYAKIKQSLLL